MIINKYLPSQIKFDIDSNPYRKPEVTLTDENVRKSFYYDDFNQPLKSSQQLKIDWSQFQNHTFFMSAEVKVNLAFEKIINYYPFDGTRQEVQDFLDSLTGFEKWVFDNFPKNNGSLEFDNSYIVVKDSSGKLFPNFSKDKSLDSKINPTDKNPISLEFKLKLPSSIQGIQQKSIICQKKSDNNMGFSVNLIDEENIPKIQFIVTSGSKYIESECEIKKNELNHIFLTLEREIIDKESISSVKIFLNQEEKFVSKKCRIGTLDVSDSDFLIGSGSTISWGNKSFTPTDTFQGILDEFRIFHSPRTLKEISNFSEKNIFPKIENDEIDLKLYYKFNESNGPIVLDHSGNSLHSTITGYNEDLRKVGLLLSENSLFNPVLFPEDMRLISFNQELIEKAKTYDIENPNLITKLIPKHFLIEGAKKDGFDEQIMGESKQSYSENAPGSTSFGSQQILLTFLYIWAKFFDEMKVFVDSFSTLKNVDYEENENVPDNFIDSMLNEFGINLPNFFSDSTVEQYIEGENIDRETGKSVNPLKWIQAQINKRFMISLPHILSSKGTQHSIKSFLRAVGIEPNNSVIIKEYGGNTRKNINNARENRMSYASMLKVYDDSYFESSYLSGSRSEPGWPYISGVFLNGISDNKNDGLFTSGSWFIETNVKFPSMNETLEDKSLIRLMTTGSLGKLVTHNLVGKISNLTGSVIELSFLDKDYLESHKLSIEIPNMSIFDGDIWNVSFGKLRNDDPWFDNTNTEYHLRIGKQAHGELNQFYSKTIKTDLVDILGTLDVEKNASGSYISVGNLENHEEIVQIPNMPLTSSFNGNISNLKFWSKCLTLNETYEHIKNYNSFGSDNPDIFYDLEGRQSGSYCRIRLDAIQNQGILNSNIYGELDILDFTKGFSSLKGQNFSFENNNFVTIAVPNSQLTTNFDEDTTNEKIKYRGVDKKTIYEEEKPWVKEGPVYRLPESEMASTNNRFSVEFSLVEALNRDIMNMFSTMDGFNEYLGNPNLIFSADYPELRGISERYFYRLDEKINFEKFFEFYRWFDSSIGLFIDQLIPIKTIFAGTRHVIEPHIFERSKFQYYFHENYTFNYYERKIRPPASYETLIRKY